MILERRCSSFYRSNVSVYWGQQPIVNSESVIYIELNARGSCRDKYGLFPVCLIMHRNDFYLLLYNVYGDSGFLLPHYENE